MKSRFIERVCLVLLFGALTPLAYAGIVDKKIPCPSINTIQQAAPKINVAQKDPDEPPYYVSGSKNPVFYESDMAWWVSASQISANSNEEALALGKEMIQKVSIQLKPYALDFGGHFLCEYRNGDVLAVGKRIK
ncbi:MAG: hypothetical protein H0W64_07480 [Gammaproteobacteria bacterium]|nr:hypothetical protein [Gammaproteobacteria bacterium]